MTTQAATSKLAQIVRGQQTCAGCGVTQPLDAYAMSRLGRPLSKCRGCVRDAIRRGRKAGAKRRASERATAAQVTTTTHAKEATPPAPIEASRALATLLQRIARAAGRARGIADLDPRLEPLADDLDAILTTITQGAS